MEKTEKLQTIQQISIGQAQSFQMKTPKRQSMRKRLSGQKSIEDFFKTFSNDLNDSKLKTPVDVKANSKDKKCYLIKNLVDLSHNSLQSKVQSDPFLKRGLKFLAKNMKENTPQSKNIEQVKSNYFDSSKISYRNYRQRTNAKQSEMFKKVINTIGKEKFYA